MLNLILGPSGTGKSTRLLETIRARAQAGEKSILLVPEQFTSSTESRIYRLLGDELSGMVSSYSFTSLAEALLDRYGGAAVRTVTDAARVVLVRRAVGELGAKITYYARHRRSPVFLKKCADTLNELKSAGVTGPLLERLSAGPGKEKFRELAAIFSAYEAILEGTALDPGDRVALAADKARSHPEFFAGRAVFVDEFDTFDAAKQQLLAAMLAGAPQVTVSLCADGLQDAEGGLGLFSGAKQVAARLQRLAAREGCGVAAPVVLTEDLRHRDAPGLAALAEALADRTQPPEGPWPGVTLYRAADLNEEAQAVAAAIQKLARAGVEYRRMAVICRDTDLYLRPVRTAFARAGIPLFVSAPTTAALSAPALLVRGLLAVLRGGLSTERVLNVAKTGLCGLTEAQVCALENYAYTWRLSAAQWREPFDRSPAGFGGGPLKPEEQRQLELAESARQRLVPILEDFVRGARGKDAPALTRRLYLTMETLGAGEATAALAGQLESAGRLTESAETLRMWNVVVRLLDQMVLLFPGEELDAAEYDEMLSLMLNSTELGHIPQTLDAVILTGAGKMRLDAPDHCFVMGLAEGQFPHVPGETGLLTHADRDALLLLSAALPEAERFQLPDRFENRVIRENVAFYKALTAAGKGLWLSWAEGAAALPLTSALPLPPEGLPEPQLTEADRCLTVEMAMDRLGAVWQQDTPLRATLHRALQPHRGALLAQMEQMGRDTGFRVEDTRAVARLLGQELYLSPSQLRSFCQCQLAYYMEYVLKVKPRRQARMDPAAGGTLIHYILEHALQTEGFAEMDEAQLAALAALLARRFMEENLPDHGAQMRYLVTRMARGAGSLLRFVQQELAVSPFAPTAFELEIGEGEGKVPPMTQTTADGRTVKLIGKIDRVDTYTDEDGDTWLRVVDYKTGTKKFTLTQVLSGQDCQMLLYLFTLTARWPLLKGQPARAGGVEYLMADPPPENVSRDAALMAGAGAAYDRQGVSADEPALQEALEAEHSALRDAAESGRVGRVKKTRAGTVTPEQMENIRVYLEDLVRGMAERLYSGQITARPCQDVHGKTGCAEWCPYRGVCGHVDGENERPHPEDKDGKLFMQKEEVRWDD